MEPEPFEGDVAEGAKALQETVFQREAIEQQLRFAHARAIREASKPPEPLVQCAVEHFRALVVGTPDDKSRALVAELGRLRANPSQPHSDALALFMLDTGCMLSPHEQNFLLNSAGKKVDGKARERKMRSIFDRILRHAEAAGLFGD